MLQFLKIMTLWLARLAFGLFLPAYLLWFLFFSHYSLQRQEAAAKAFETLNLSLDRLEKYHDDQVFFHALLQKNFVRADVSSEPAKKLADTVAAFRRIFAQKVRFIVWNKDGKVNAALSDEKRFQFILKTMFTVMHELLAAFKSGEWSDPSGLGQISEKMNLLRGYFGPFLFESQLFDPLKPDFMGKSLFVGIESDKRLLWYYPGSNFSLACFIDASLTGVQWGPAAMIKHANSMPRPQKLAYIKTISYQSYGLPQNIAEQTEIKLEARKFESYAVSARESAEFLISFRQVTPDLIVLSYQRKGSMPDPQRLAAAKLMQVFKWLFIGAFVLYCYYLRMPGWCLSVQQKMLLLFLFSNGLPILVLISTGYEFFHEKKNDLINSAHQESLRVLKEFDVRFPEIESALAGRINAFVDERNARYGGGRWPQAEIDVLKNQIAEIRPEEAMLFEKSGNRAFYVSNSSNRAEKLVIDMMQRALDFFSMTRDFEQQKTRDSMLEKVSSNDLILHYFLTYLDKFSIQSSGSSERITFMKFTGNIRVADIWGLLAVSWERSLFMREFVGDHLTAVATEVLPRRLAVMDKKTEQIYAATPLRNTQVRRLMRQTKSRKLITTENIDLDGQKYLFTSISGNELSEGILVALFPQQLIEESIYRLKVSIIAGILLIIFVLLQIVRLFSRRLLAPVEGLARGMESIRQRDFTARVDYSSEDELGQLIKAFNQTVEGLQELAIGTAVQVSLLPPEKFRKGRVNLFARSLFMSKMGGDYFDYFELPQNRLGIFFGDVAGHGIPAAMIMAMAKALITAATSKFAGPADILNRGNLVLQHLKKRNWRRMMTAQCLDFNCETGEFIIASAGHCYPVIVAPGGVGTAMVEINGFPLGSASKKEYEELCRNLKPGETLILYTDGIIEATNAAGEMFDYSRFTRLLQTAWSEDLETYWQQIYAGYQAWAVAQDDDLTFLMLRFEEEHHDA